jgi:hypothetical protein
MTLRGKFWKLKGEVYCTAWRGTIAVEEAMDLSAGRTNFADVAGHNFTSSATVSFSKRNLV